MNVYKKIALLSLFSIISVNALAVDTTEVVTARAKKIEAKNFSFKKLTPAVKYAAVLTLWISYMKWSSSSTPKTDNPSAPKPEKATQTGLFSPISNCLKDPVLKKWLEVAPVAVFAVDIFRDDLKIVKNWIAQKWDNATTWADNQCGFTN